MILLYTVLGTAIGGGLLWWATRPGGIASDILPRTADFPSREGNAYNEEDGNYGVIVGGSSGTSPYQQGRSNISTGLGLASSINSAGAGGALGTTVAASQAVPIIGLALAGAAVFWSMLQEHHKKAVALEASTLNNAVPHFRQTMVMVASAAVKKQISSQQLNAVLDQAITDYYTMVSKIIKGKWPASASDTPPNPCNGPCVVGHWWIERDANSLRGLVDAIAKGQHGQIAFDTVPAHAGFQGSPSITINF